jgi:uncharacterized protein (DUF1800 family)
MEKSIEQELNVNINPAENNPDIKHLLSRALLGVSNKERRMFASKTRAEALSILLASGPHEESLPLKDYDSIQSPNPDQRVSLGTTWINDYNHDSVINDKRRYSLKNWLMGVLYQEKSLSLLPKMFIFWSDLFTLETKKINYLPRAFNHYSIIRTNALGNYKELLINVVTDQTMVYYLNRIMPSGEKSNDYIVRKILNEYCIGPEYQKFVSKEKIKRLTRLLSKWNLICDSMVLHFRNLKPREIYEAENIKYQNAYFNKSDAREVIDEMGDILHRILKHPAAGLRLSRKLFCYFGNAELIEQFEKKLIEPAANVFTSSGYDIREWLKSFFLNDHFYHPSLKGGTPKSPIEFLFTLCKQTDLYSPSSNSFANYPYWDWLRFKAETLGQDMGDPPGAGGLPAYNQHPYQQVWMNPESMYQRQLITERLIDSGYRLKDKNLFIDPVKVVKRCPNPGDADALIEFLYAEFYAVVPAKEVRGKIKELYLLNGTRENEFWASRWKNAFAYNIDAEKKAATMQLKHLLKYLLTQPEYNYC